MITRNRCQCAHCGEIIESRSVHEWVSCDCGAISTDGGNAYLHRSWREAPTDIIDLTEYDDEA